MGGGIIIKDNPNIDLLLHKRINQNLEDIFVKFMEGVGNKFPMPTSSPSQEKTLNLEDIFTNSGRKPLTLSKPQRLTIRI